MIRQVHSQVVRFQRHRNRPARSSLPPVIYRPQKFSDLYANNFSVFSNLAGHQRTDDTLVTSPVNFHEFLYAFFCDIQALGSAQPWQFGMSKNLFVIKN